MQIGHRDFLKHTGMIGLGAGVGAVLSPSMARAAPSANPDVVICGGPLLHQMAGKTSRPAASVTSASASSASARRFPPSGCLRRAGRTLEALFDGAWC